MRFSWLLQERLARYGIPGAILADNAKEFLHGACHKLCLDNKIDQTFSPPYSPNFNPTERYMEIIIRGAKSIMHHAGVDRHCFWSDAVLHRTEIQNVFPIKGIHQPPFELHTGESPNVLYLRVWGCEALYFVERDLWCKFDDRTERCLYLGIS